MTITEEFEKAVEKIGTERLKAGDYDGMGMSRGFMARQNIPHIKLSVLQKWINEGRDLTGLDVAHSCDQMFYNV